MEEYIKKQEEYTRQGLRAQVLLKADADGPCWTDARLADAKVAGRRPWRTSGSESSLRDSKVTLNAPEGKNLPRAKLLDSEQEAKVIAFWFDCGLHAPNSNRDFLTLS